METTKSPLHIVNEQMVSSTFEILSNKKYKIKYEWIDKRKEEERITKIIEKKNKTKH